MKNSLQKGFTLIELLVVIAIIAILSAIVITSLAPAQRKAKIAAFQSEVRGVAPDFVIKCDDDAIAIPSASTTPTADSFNNIDWSDAVVASDECGVGLGTFVIDGIKAQAFDAAVCSARIVNGNVEYSGSECN